MPPLFFIEYLGRLYFVHAQCRTLWMQCLHEDGQTLSLTLRMQLERFYFGLFLSMGPQMSSAVNDYAKETELENL